MVVEGARPSAKAKMTPVPKAEPRGKAASASEAKNAPAPKAVAKETKQAEPKVEVKQVQHHPGTDGLPPLPDPLPGSSPDFGGGPEGLPPLPPFSPFFPFPFPPLVTGSCLGPGPGAA